MEDVCIDTFTEKLRHRVAIRSDVTWADAKPAQARPFGFHPWVFKVPLAVGVVLAIKDLIGGAL